MEPRDDASQATPQEMFEWLRDRMMPAVREGRAQPCFLKHKGCSDAPSGRCAMIAVALTSDHEEFARDTYRWLAEIQKANRETHHGS